MTTLRSLKSSAISLSASPAIAKSPLAPQLQLTTRAAADPGATLRTATPIKPVPGSFTLANRVSRTDTDLLRLRLNAPAQVTISFRNRNAQPITVSLLDTRGQVLTINGQKLSQAFGIGTFTQSYSGVLPGRYFVRMTARARKDLRYRIQVTVASLSIA